MDATTLEVPLDAEFLAAAEAAQREPSAIVADLMREFVERERSAYTDFLRRKVEKARRSYRDGHWQSNADIEAAFLAKRRAFAEGSDDLK